MLTRLGRIRPDVATGKTPGAGGGLVPVVNWPDDAPGEDPVQLSSLFRKGECPSPSSLQEK